MYKYYTPSGIKQMFFLCMSFFSMSSVGDTLYSLPICYQREFPRTIPNIVNALLFLFSVSQLQLFITKDWNEITFQSSSYQYFFQIHLTCQHLYWDTGKEVWERGMGKGGGARESWALVSPMFSYQQCMCDLLKFLLSPHSHPYPMFPLKLPFLA